MDEEVAALVVDNGSGMCKKLVTSLPTNSAKGINYARVGDDGIVIAIQSFSEPPQPTSEWKICKENTAKGFPY